MTIKIAVSETDQAACFAVRERVFVQEQNVPPDLEMDALDATATHFLLCDAMTGAALGTARLLDKKSLAQNRICKIGRVALLPQARGRGLGRSLMEAVLDEARARGYTVAVLDAQTYAVPFYARLGFVAEGDEFPDAGIPHFHMRLRL